MGWNAKVRCIDDKGVLHTKGKIYSVEDGYLECNWCICGGNCFINIEDLNKNMYSQFELIKPSYWDNICKMQQKQTNKGIKHYGQVLEDNLKMDMKTRLEYLQEEMIDGLMYIEHIKALLGIKGAD